jgi:dienelactone hydrolase
VDQSRRQLIAGMAAVCLAPCSTEGKAGLTSSFEVASRLPGSQKEHQALMVVLGDMPNRPPAVFTTLETVQLDTGTRYKIEYLSEPADSRFHTPIDTVRAYLFVPTHNEGKKLPAVIAIHQDGPQFHIGKSEPAGLAGDKNLYYGLELFQRGYVVLCPDRFYHAERRRVAPNDMTSIDPERDIQLLNHRVGQLLLSGRSCLGKEVYDLEIATDIISSLDCVDQEKVGAIGHSAGGNVLVYFMFADRRIRAGISSCGLFDLIRFFDERAAKRRLAAFAVPNFANVATSADYLVQIAPRSVLLTRGLWEWGTEGEDAQFSKEHVQETKDMVAYARSVYALAGASASLDAVYFDEAGGNHDFPPQVRRHCYEWLDEQLK